MTDLVVIEFPSEAEAEEVRRRLIARQKDYLVELADAVIAVKAPDGSVKLNQIINPIPVGAVYGGTWGFLIGLIFLMPLVGAALGAAAGAVTGALSDLGIDDSFMKDAASSLHSGKAALFLLVRKLTTEKILDDFRNSGGKVLRTSFDPEKEGVLRAALEGAQTVVREHADPASRAAHSDDNLDRGLEDSFPASDPVSATTSSIATAAAPRVGR